MPNPLRYRVIAESKGSGAGFGREVAKKLEGVLPAGAKAEAPLTEAERAKAAAALAQFGKADRPLATWGDVFDAVTGDVDGDAKGDVDLEALAAATGTQSPFLAYSLRQAQSPLYVEQTISTGDDPQLGGTPQL